MAVDERERMELRESLERTLGRDSAVTLMTMLPPDGWADVARRRDLNELEARVDTRFDLFEQKLDTLRNELLAAFRGELVTAVALQTRMVLWGVFGAVAIMASLAFALVRFA